MKKEILLIVFICFTTISCEKNEPINEVNPIIEFEGKANSKVEREVAQFDLNHPRRFTPKGITFDMKELKVSSLKGSESKAVVAHQIGFDPNSNSNYSLVYFYDGNEVFDSQIYKMNKVSEYEKEIECYNSNGNLIYSLRIDFKAHTTELYSYYQGETFRTGCGQDTMDCLSDAYTQHGWISVWATVQTAFIPYTAAALAAACAYKNCL